MFRLSSHKLVGRRILIIEDDDQTADVLGLAIRDGGGSVVAHVSSIEAGLKVAVEQPLDQALVHIRFTVQTPLNIPEAFATHGVEIVFIACHDDWFDFDDDIDGQPARIAV